MATKAISKREYDERDSALNIADGNMKAAKAAVDVAKLNLDYTNVIAPISGKIGRAEITVGNTVNAGPGAPTLTRIVSLSPIYASFEVDEQTFLSHIQKYSAEELKMIPVQLGLANQSDTPFLATISSFDNQLNTASGTIRVRALYNNADLKIVPGLFVRVRLGSPTPESRILISEKAVGTDQSKKYVYVVGADNMAAYREITLGAAAEGMRVVRSGLSAGDKIIVNGLMRVRPGAPVTPELVSMANVDAPAAAPPQAEAMKKEDKDKENSVLILDTK
jgi:multidrug efflux system membrane fusion protein